MLSGIAHPTSVATVAQHLADSCASHIVSAPVMMLTPQQVARLFGISALVRTAAVLVCWVQPLASGAAQQRSAMFALEVHLDRLFNDSARALRNPVASTVASLASPLLHSGGPGNASQVRYLRQVFVDAYPDLVLAGLRATANVSLNTAPRRSPPAKWYSHVFVPTSVPHRSRPLRLQSRTAWRKATRPKLF